MPGDPQIQRFKAGPVSAADLDAWLAAAPLAAPLRSFCAATCPDTAAACARALLVVVGGHAGLAVIGTPSETLIPPEVWGTSERGRAALLRQAPGISGGSPTRSLPQTAASAPRSPPRWPASGTEPYSSAPRSSGTCAGDTPRRRAALAARAAASAASPSST